MKILLNNIYVCLLHATYTKPYGTESSAIMTTYMLTIPRSVRDLCVFLIAMHFTGEIGLSVSEWDHHGYLGGNNTTARSASVCNQVSRHQGCLPNPQRVHTNADVLDVNSAFVRRINQSVVGWPLTIERHTPYRMLVNVTSHRISTGFLR